jgi:hypothetical protein
MRDSGLVRAAKSELLIPMPLANVSYVGVFLPSPASFEKASHYRETSRSRILLEPNRIDTRRVGVSLDY